METKIHSIVLSSGKPIPDKMVVTLQNPAIPGSVHVSYKLPGQPSMKSLGILPVVDGVLVLPVKLIFLSYAREDFKAVEAFADKLTRDGFLTWLDRKDIRPGDSWKTRIKRGMESSDHIVIFLSRKSVAKRGYVQVEMKQAFELQEYYPDGQRFIIPARLDEVVPPDRFEDIAWVDLWEDDGYERLKDSLEC